MPRGELYFHALQKGLMIAFEMVQHSDGGGIVAVVDGGCDYLHADGGKFIDISLIMPEVFSAVLDNFFDMTRYER